MPDNSIHEINDGKTYGPLSFGFDCIICEEVQEVETVGGHFATTVPICDQCKSDLKEIVFKKRNKKE